MEKKSIKYSFEEARDRLSEIVQMLEKGGLTLDESLNLWQQGQELGKFCEEKLSEAQEKINSTILEDEKNLKEN